MKLRYAILLSFLLIAGVLSVAAHADDAAGKALPPLSLEVHSENSSNLYWDSETIAPQKPILLSWRASSTSGNSMKARVHWKLLDADGKKVLSGSDKYEIGAGSYAEGRQLFKPKARGAYLWVVQAEVKLDGPDIEKTAAMPLAVISKPQTSPDPFLSVNTSAVPPVRLTEFYRRMGAQVWRSPVITASGDSLLHRIDDGIERLAVLPAPASGDMGNWGVQVETLLHSYQVRSWEFASPGDVSLTDLLNRPGVQQVVNDLEQASDQRPAISLQGLWPETASLPPGMNQFALQLPVPDADVNSAARRRAVIFAKTMVRDMGFSGLALHEGDDVPAVAVPLSPRESAAALTQNVALAYGVGARGYSVSLNPAAPPFKDAVEFDSTRDALDQLIPWERAAAYSATSNLLGNAQFVKELFSETPAVYCALFQNGDTSLAVLWSMQDDKGKLQMRLPGAVLLDADGNEVDKADGKGNLTVPLTHIPYYVRIKGTPPTLGKAMRSAAIKGISSVRVQVLPVTEQVTGNDNNVLRVRLQNITPHPCSGVVAVEAPKGWEVPKASQQFVLKPGKWRVYEFPVQRAKQSYNLQMRVKVRVNNGVTGNWTWRGQPALAIAMGGSPESTFTIDGDLSEWKNAVWMKAQNGQFNRKAQLAVSWDARNLYVAARVDERRIAARDGDTDPYRFWNGDAIQLAFGWREQPWMLPSAASFRDTDYGILLAPFDKTAGGAVQGRVLSLWSPTIPFAGTMDHVRWGGAVRGAQCSIQFDSRKGETVYEAAIPLAALGDLDPQARGGMTPDQPIRFSWIAHTYDGVPVQWADNAGVYPWWGNSASFLPVRKGYLAAQGLLGFAQSGDVGSSQVLPPAKPEKTKPSKQQPSLPPPPTVVHPAPPQNQVPSLPFPVPVQPIPPNLLPPAPPEG